METGVDPVALYLLFIFITLLILKHQIMDKVINHRQRIIEMGLSHCLHFRQKVSGCDFISVIRQKTNI